MQRYGTQLTVADDGTLSPLPIEDPDAVEDRRRAVGLEPLAERLATAGRIPPPKDREAYERGYEAWLRKAGWRTLGVFVALLASWPADALAAAARLASPAERPVAIDTTTIVVTKPTVIAYLVIPEGVVDSQPDVAVLADDWNVAMATLGDSLAAHGIAFALVTQSRLTVRSAASPGVVLNLAPKPAAGYVYARPGATPCLRRGAAEIAEVLAAARQCWRPTARRG